MRKTLELFAAIVLALVVGLIVAHAQPATSQNSAVNQSSKIKVEATASEDACKPKEDQPRRVTVVASVESVRAAIISRELGAGLSLIAESPSSVTFSRKQGGAARAIGSIGGLVFSYRDAFTFANDGGVVTVWATAQYCTARPGRAEDCKSLNKRRNEAARLDALLGSVVSEVGR